MTTNKQRRHTSQSRRRDIAKAAADSLRILVKLAQDIKTTTDKTPPDERSKDSLRNQMTTCLINDTEIPDPTLQTLCYQMVTRLHDEQLAVLHDVARQFTLVSGHLQATIRSHAMSAATMRHHAVNLRATNAMAAGLKPPMEADWPTILRMIAMIMLIVADLWELFQTE